MTSMPSSSLLRTACKEDLRAIAQESGICLSLFLGIRPGEPARTRPLLDKAQTELASAGLSASEVDAFLSPVAESAELALKEQNPATRGIALLRSTEQFHAFRLPFKIPDRVTVSSTFFALPLLKCMSLQPEFYILALSQKNSRLIRCTRDSSEEIDLPSHIATNLADYTKNDFPDHRLENRSHGGQKGSGGAHPGMIVAFGTSSDNERKDEYLQHYYNELDKQLQSFLRDHPLPLVVAGVDYQVAMYHRISEYQALVPGGVQGAPDSLKGGELHARALEVLDQSSDATAEKALAQFEKAGGERIQTRIPEIVHSAYDGRILHLFLAEGAEHPGLFNPGSREIREGAAGGEDLLNFAGLQTIAHGGDVFVLPPNRIPGDGKAAATLRF